MSSGRYFDASLATRILDRSLQKGLEKAKAFCTSKQLRRSMFIKITEEAKRVSRGVIRSPQYWSIYYHIGRANFPPIRASSASYLVWFKNPRDDPRLTNGQYPMYRSQIKSLSSLISKAEFRRLKEEGKLIVSKTSPRSGGASFPGNPFFSDTGGMVGFGADVGKIAQEEAYQYVESFLKKSGLKHKVIVRNV